MSGAPLRQGSILIPKLIPVGIKTDPLGGSILGSKRGDQFPPPIPPLRALAVSKLIPPFSGISFSWMVLSRDQCVAGKWGSYLPHTSHPGTPLQAGTQGSRHTHLIRAASTKGKTENDNRKDNRMETRKLTDDELKAIPSHICRDCDTVFGYEHDDIFDEGEEACCPYDNQHQNVILVRDHPNHIDCLFIYAGQLEEKLEKHGLYCHFSPYGVDAE